MEKVGVNYLRVFLLFVITLIITAIEIATGKFGKLIFRIGKALTILGSLGQIGRNWAILKQEIDDLSDDEVDSLSLEASRELDIPDSALALEITKRGIKLARDIVEFVDELKSAGKIKQITG